MQGVSYRATAREAALRLGVHGWVRNLPNGDVEAVAEGDPDTVERFVAWCRRGPEEASVEAVTVTEASPTGEFASFQVVR